MKNQNYRKTVEELVKVILPSIIQTDHQVSFHQAIDTSITLAKYVIGQIQEVTREDPDQAKMNFPGSATMDNIDKLKQSTEEMIEAIKKLKPGKSIHSRKIGYVGPQIEKDQIEGTVQFNEETKKFEHRDDDGDLIELNDQGIFQKVKDQEVRSDESAEEVDPGKLIYDQINSKLGLISPQRSIVILLQNDNLKHLEEYCISNQFAAPTYSPTYEKSRILYAGHRVIRTSDIEPGEVRILEVPDYS